jgi:PKD repeat protein
MGCRDVNPVASTDSVPAIKSVIPAEAPYGAAVSIGGTGFGKELAGQEVYFNNTLAKIQALNDTSIQTRVPLEAVSGPVMVVTDEGDTLSGPSFSVDSTQNLFLSIDRIEPVKGRAGDEVALFGSGFGDTPEQNNILFNNLQAPVNEAADTMLITQVPMDAQTGPVSVVVAKDTAVGPEFVVIGGPMIEAISPESGSPGTGVTISGSGFSSTANNNTVTFNGENAAVETASENEILAIVPETAETGPVAVTVAGETAEGPTFTVTPENNPKSLRVVTETNNSPGGFDGYRLSVTGKDVRFINPNGEQIIENILADEVDVELSDVLETCSVSGQNPRTVKLESEVTTTTFTIDCELPAPQISSINPESGSVGTEVTISGGNFSATPAENLITFNGTEAPVNSASTTELVTQVPEGATNGPIEVTVNGKTAEGPTFMVEANAPSIASIDPQSGVVGTEVTISGENFSATPAENLITFNGTEAPVNSAGTTELITQVPEGATDGPVEVTVDGKTGTGPDFDVVTTGSLDVVIATQGEDQDSNGYLVSIDGTEGVRTDINETYNQSGLEQGTHQVGISDIADNCFITQDRPNPHDVSITSGQTTTTNFDIQCEAVNEPPTAEFTYDCTNLGCDFDASTSSDPEGAITDYSWVFGDGATGSGQTVNHNYEIAGTYSVELTVTDDNGSEDTITKDVTVTLPEIDSISPTEGPTGTEVTINGSGFSATASDNVVEFTSGSAEVQATIKSASETQLVVDVPGDATTGPVYVTTHGYRVQGPTFTLTNTGTLEVNISTGGVSQDPNGYDLIIDGGGAVAVDNNDRRTFDGLEQGTHSVEMADIAANCFITQDRPNPYDVQISTGQTTSTAIDVRCEEVNQPPTASFGFTCDNLSCDFDASGSSDPDGFISVWKWSYGDGTNSTEPGSTVSHSYETPGTYTVTLTVADNEGSEDTITKDVTVTLPNINSISPAEGPIGTEVTINGSGFSATASDNVVEFTSGSTEVQATIKSASETQLVVDVPGDATTGPVYVSTHGYRVQGPTFTVEQPKSLEVSIVTSGSNIDPDGYTLSVEGVDDRFVKANDNITYNDLYADEVQVQLSGIAANCAVGGANPRTVNLNNPDNAGFTEFDISCQSSLKGKVFFSGRSDGRELFVINPDGTNQKMITDNSLSEFYPVVSNDGTKIAFASFGRSGNRQLFVVNADGTNLEQVTSTGDRAVPGGWSPDDSQIVFEYDASDCTECGLSEIFTINADGSNLTRLTTSTGSSVQATGPDWSPDGENIVYANRFDAQGYDIMMMNADGSNKQRLTNTSSSEFNPRWSPDGTQIAFDSNEIFIMNADGSNIIRLTDVNSTPNDGINYCKSPSWSPGGSRLVFACDDFGIYRMPVDGSSNMVKVADGDHPDWVSD